MQENGQVLQAMPEIRVAWDEKNQNVILKFQANEFKSYPFLIACLEMAAKEAEKNWRMAQMAAMVQQQQEQAQAQAIASQLKNKL